MEWKTDWKTNRSPEKTSVETDGGLRCSCSRGHGERDTHPRIGTLRSAFWVVLVWTDYSFKCGQCHKGEEDSISTGNCHRRVTFLSSPLNSNEVIIPGNLMMIGLKQPSKD